MKHHTLMNGLTIDRFHDSFVTAPISDEKKNSFCHGWGIYQS